MDNKDRSTGLRVELGWCTPGICTRTTDYWATAGRQCELHSMHRL